MRSGVRMHSYIYSTTTDYTLEMAASAEFTFFIILFLTCQQGKWITLHPRHLCGAWHHDEYRTQSTQSTTANKPQVDGVH